MNEGTALMSTKARLFSCKLTLIRPQEVNFKHSPYLRINTTFALQPQDWASPGRKAPRSASLRLGPDANVCQLAGEGRRGRMSFAPRFGGRELQEREPVGPTPAAHTRGSARDRAPRAHLNSPRLPALPRRRNPTEALHRGIRDAGVLWEAGGGAKATFVHPLGKAGALRARMPSATSDGD